MKIANYMHMDKNYIGLVDKDANRVISLNLIDEKYSNIVSINELIDTFGIDIIAELSSYNLGEIKDSISLDDVKLLAPIPYPKRNIICLGKNYKDHAQETKGLPGGSEEDIPKFPIYFSKIANPAIGMEDVILSHSDITDKVDYEVELAVIIGKKGINIDINDAEDYIFGYTIVNDISARNIQRKHGQWFKGKSLDTHCPMGPYIVCKDEIHFPVELDITCSINGELRQNSNTRELIFNIPEIIADISKGMTLEPGDIIITGTPAGVGLGFKPFKFLKSGDTIDCYIERIGNLQNKFV